eukprot:2077164-Amphidinium_carterae.1
MVREQPMYSNGYDNHQSCLSIGCVCFRMVQAILLERWLKGPPQELDHRHAGQTGSAQSMSWST